MWRQNVMNMMNPSFNTCGTRLKLIELDLHVEMNGRNMITEIKPGDDAEEDEQQNTAAHRSRSPRLSQANSAQFQPKIRRCSCSASVRMVMRVSFGGMMRRVVSTE